MADTAENEPTMEEILSSIRRIINEDDEAPAEESAEPEAAADDAFDAADAFDSVDMDSEPEEAGDVLELTEKVDEPDAGTDPLAVDDDLMIVDREDEFDAVPEPSFEAAVEDEVEDAIMGEPAAAMAAGAFGSLLDNIRISETEGQTLEGVVRALLRPMLKDWLDVNLPDIVEEKVQAEIERVARRRR